MWTSNSCRATTALAADTVSGSRRSLGRLGSFEEGLRLPGGTRGLQAGGQRLGGGFRLGEQRREQALKFACVRGVAHEQPAEFLGIVTQVRGQCRRRDVALLGDILGLGFVRRLGRRSDEKLPQGGNQPRAHGRQVFDPTGCLDRVASDKRFRGQMALAVPLPVFGKMPSQDGGGRQNLTLDGGFGEHRPQRRRHWTGRGAQFIGHNANYLRGGNQDGGSDSEQVRGFEAGGRKSLEVQPRQIQV